MDILSGPLLTPAAVEGTQVIQEAWLISSPESALPSSSDATSRSAAPPYIRSISHLTNGFYWSRMQLFYRDRITAKERVPWNTKFLTVS